MSITKYDIDVFRDMYEIDVTNVTKFCVMPIGVESGIGGESAIESLEFRSEKKRCLLTGSLWFGPNVDGILWFLDEVFETVSDICDITIVGFSPLPELKYRCKKNRIRLIESPETMNPFFMSSDMVLAPIFSGSGMKVKVAEAMSYGLPVITTSHGAIGYEIENGVDGYVVHSAFEFSNAIRKYHTLSDIEKMEFSKRVYRKYESKYSYYAMKSIMERNFNEFFFSA